MRKKQYATDIVFIVSLFCVFAILALFVVLLGANVYRGISAGMTQNSSARTSVAYVTEKIRQGDAAGGVSVEEVFGGDALVIAADTGESRYETWIYASGGELKEITVAAGSTFAADAGQPVMEIGSIGFAQDGGLITIDAVDASGNEWSSAVAVMSEAGRG